MHRTAFSPLLPHFKGLRNSHFGGSTNVLPGRRLGPSQTRTREVRWIRSTAKVHVDDEPLNVARKVRSHMFMGKFQTLIPALYQQIRKRRVISTLDPRKLSPSDLSDISLTRHATTTIGAPPNVPFETFETFETLRPTPFAPDRRGFFYYHTPLNLPLTAGEVRFRLTHDGDPKTFDNASDLLAPSGLPWSIPIWRIASLSRYSSMKDLLLKENLISEDLLVQCQSLAPPQTSNVHVVYALGQPIAVARGRTTKVWVLGKSSLKSFTLDHIEPIPQETSSDAQSPLDFFHVSFGLDRTRNRFVYRVVAQFQAQPQTLLSITAEPSEIRKTRTEGDPYEALCLLLDEEAEHGVKVKTLEQRVSFHLWIVMPTFQLIDLYDSRLCTIRAPSQRFHPGVSKRQILWTCLRFASLNFGFLALLSGLPIPSNARRWDMQPLDPSLEIHAVSSTTIYPKISQTQQASFAFVTRPTKILRVFPKGPTCFALKALLGHSPFGILPPPRPI